MTKAELIEKKRAKLAEARAMVDAAKAANRALTADQQRNFNLTLAEADNIQGQIDSIAPETQRVASRDWDHDDRRLQDGRAIGLRSKDRLVEYLQRRGQVAPNAEPVSFGELARAYITGRTDRLNDAERRAFAESTLTGGGVLAPSPIAADVIDMARAQARVIQAGALTVPMVSGSLSLAKINEPIVPGWKGENEEGVESTAAFGEIILTAKTLHVHAYCSLELIEDAPNAAEVIEREFTAAMAQEFDRVALFGTGLVNQPKGLYYHAGVNIRTLGAGNGATPTDYDFLIDAVGDVWAAHAEPTAILYASRTAVTLAKLKEGTTSAPLAVPPALVPVPRLVTNQVPTNLTIGTSTDCSAAFTGDYRKLAIGIRVGFQFEVSRDAGEAFKKGQVMIRARLRGDIGVLRSTFFTVTKGIRG
jgi:HK97 family phage major capsid protein